MKVSFLDLLQFVVGDGVQVPVVVAPHVGDVAGAQVGSSSQREHDTFHGLLVACAHTSTVAGVTA